VTRHFGVGGKKRGV